MPASTRVDLQGNRYGFLPWRKQVIKHCTGSTATYNITRQESGSLFYVPKVSTAKFVLPDPSSLVLGLTYEFYIAAQDSTGDIQIVSTGNSSWVIAGVVKTTAIAVTDKQSASLPTTVAAQARITLVTSNVWLFEQTLMIVNDYTSDDALLKEDFMGAWTTGTTA